MQTVAALSYKVMHAICRRPTFLPAMKQKKLDQAKVMADPTARMMAEYVHALADLAHPKACIPLLHDHARLDAFRTAIKGALHELPGDCISCLSFCKHMTGSCVAGGRCSAAGSMRRVGMQVFEMSLQRHLMGTTMHGMRPMAHLLTVMYLLRRQLELTLLLAMHSSDVA